MKKQTKKLMLKKATVSILNQELRMQLNGGSLTSLRTLNTCTSTLTTDFA